ncbi:hypothetical protein LIER_31903 [Lithospermum erythrorhizon]|uniref:Uncharacterized protein n=1 Tax=Lithospermum erythrorhizon TaxID=34254 RepID=A0AAV3RUR0_LITER
MLKGMDHPKYGDQTEIQRTGRGGVAPAHPDESPGDPPSLSNGHLHSGTLIGLINHNNLFVQMLLVSLQRANHTSIKLNTVGNHHLLNKGCSLPLQ